MGKQKEVLLVIYGEGGHRTEMQRLLASLEAAAVDLKVVSLGVEPLSDQESEQALAHYPIRDIRRKHVQSKFQRLKGLLLFPVLLITALLTVVKISRRYQITGAISTGPGLSIVPMLLLRLMGIKCVFVETFCRFNSRSLTGQVMSKIAHRFLIQNKELQILYSDAEYSGRL